MLDKTKTHDDHMRALWPGCQGALRPILLTIYGDNFEISQASVEDYLLEDYIGADTTTLAMAENSDIYFIPLGSLLRWRISLTENSRATRFLTHIRQWHAIVDKGLLFGDVIDVATRMAHPVLGGVIGLLHEMEHPPQRVHEETQLDVFMGGTLAQLQLFNARPLGAEIFHWHAMAWKPQAERARLLPNLLPFCKLGEPLTVP
jgi:hypothetical protein